MQRKFTSIGAGEHTWFYIFSLPVSNSLLTFPKVPGSVDWKLTEPKHVPVCLLTNTFERLLAGRWSVFWPSYLCFSLKLVNKVRCRVRLKFNVLAWLLPVLAEECSGACQPGLIFFLHQVRCAAYVVITGATTSPSVLPLFFLKMMFDIYFPQNAGFMSRFYLALFPVHSLLTPPSFCCIPVTNILFL